MTVAQVESVLIARRGSAIVACGLSATPAADTSPRTYLGEVIASALGPFGNWTANPVAPTDAEVGNVANGRPRMAFLDVAEYRLIETCLGQFSQVTYKSNEGQQDLSDHRAGLTADAARKLAYIAANYPELGLVAPAAGKGA